jgi:hypothetical protein
VTRARIIFALALLPALVTHAGDPELAVPRLAGPVTLDGRLEEAPWRAAARISSELFTRWVADTYTKDPTIFNLRLFHDGRTLYVALVSYDRYVEADAVPEASDGLYAFSLATRGGALQHYRLRWSANPPVAGGEMIDPGKWAARLRGPYADPAQEAAGYVIEFAIPLAATGWRAGDAVPINVIVQDHDGRPGAPYNDPGAEYARFAFGSFDNDNRAGYRTLRLAR